MMRGNRFVGMAALAAVIAGCASKAPEELAKAPPPPPRVVGPPPPHPPPPLQPSAPPPPPPPSPYCTTGKNTHTSATIHPASASFCSPSSVV
jgi:hypothetical protein